MFSYHQELHGFAEQAEKLKALPDVANKHLKTAMSSSMTMIVSKAKPVAPVGVSGMLRDSLGSEARSEGPFSIVGKAGSRMKDEVYPLVMEEGRKPGSMPPPSALVRWVTLKLGVEEWKAYSVAFNVARKIAAVGIKGKRFLKTGYEQAKPSINVFFTKALEQIAKAMENGRK